MLLSCALRQIVSKIPYEPILDLCNNSKHTVFEPDEFSLACSRCKAFFKRSNPSFKQWLKGNCYAIGSAIDRPIPLQQEFIHIGTLSIHFSHKPYKFHDTYFCKRCGCFARTKIRNLAKPCEVPTESGKPFLNNISKGILPKTGYLYSRLPVSELNVLSEFQISVDQVAAAALVEDSPSPSASHISSCLSPFSVAGSD